MAHIMCHSKTRIRSPDGSELFPQTNAKWADVKVVLLGDTRVDKTKLMQRLLSEYNPVNNSRYRLTLYEHCENLAG
jgi:Rab-like protein 2